MAIPKSLTIIDQTPVLDYVRREPQRVVACDTAAVDFSDATLAHHDAACACFPIIPTCLRTRTVT